MTGPDIDSSSMFAAAPLDAAQASEAEIELVLLKDHRPEAESAQPGYRSEVVALLAGQDAQRLFDLCDRESVHISTGVARLVWYLSQRWAQLAVLEPGATARDVLREDVAAVLPRDSSVLSFRVVADSTLTPLDVSVAATWDETAVQRATVASFMSSLRTLIRACLDEPESELDALPIASAASDREALLLASDGEPSVRLSYRTVPEAVLAWAAVQPDRPAIRFQGRTIGYADLVRRASGLAFALSSLGVRRGHRVLLYSRQSHESIVGMLATHLVGAAYVPLDVDQPVTRLAQIVAETSAAACLLGDTPGGSDPLVFLPGHVAVTRICDTGGSSSPFYPQASPEDAAYVLFTSGSTGMPKGIEVSHSSLNHFCAEIGEAYNITASDRLLAFARPVFDTSVLEVFAPLATGASVSVADADTRLDPVLLSAFMRDEAITVASLPPAIVPLLDPDELPSLRLLSVGGEAVPGAIVEKWGSGGRQLWNGYGPTEATVIVTLQRLEGVWKAPPPIGRPIRGCSAYVVDQHLALLPRGAAGELCVAGPSLATGYLNDAVRTAASFVELPQLNGVRVYRTGDLVRWRGDGTLDFLGRIDRQVKVNGFRVELAEIEDALVAVGGVRQAAVELVPARGGGRALACLVVNPEGLSTQQVLGALREAMPGYAVPSRMVAVDALPVTPNGKIDRAAVTAVLTDG